MGESESGTSLADHFLEEWSATRGPLFEDPREAVCRILAIETAAHLSRLATERVVRLRAARVLGEAVAAGRRVAEGVRMVLQYGSEGVRDYARAKGYVETFQRAGVEVIDPGCGACIGCGPGVSERPEQVTVSAINRNFAGRSGPGKLYLASPLTVAASAIEGRIVAYRPGMFRQPVGAR